MMSLLARNLGRVLFVTAGVLILATVAIGLSLDRANPDRIGLETAKVVATLAVGLILGGVLKLATESYAETRKRHEDEASRYDALIRDMHNSHDRMETARLLIAAHRSAETYDEQVRGVIDAHVLLLNVARTPGMGVLHPKLSDAEHLECMLGYSVALQREYQANYKRIMTLQRYDDELTKRAFAACASGSLLAEGATCPPGASELAWTHLNSSGEFPVLDDLCGGGTEFRTCFVEACAALRHELAKAKAEPRPPRPPGSGQWPAEGELRDAIEARADEIAERCRVAALERRPVREPADALV